MKSKKQEDRIMYTEKELVRIARRENNNKRNYLVVNRLQGKHIPVRPCEALAMFRALADTIRDRYGREKLLVIGFAETATAIGAAVAAELGADYMHTTRESVPGAGYLYFSEEHSHATQQKLVREEIDRVIGTTDRIVFVEDEVTTGKTILNLIGILRKQYSEQIHFTVVSILNGMDEAALEAYRGLNIELFWLVKTDHAAYTEIAEAYRGDGSYIRCSEEAAFQSGEAVQYPRPEDTGGAGDRAEQASPAGSIRIKAHMDARRIVGAAGYAEYCGSLYQEIVSQMDLDNVQRLLVLGTEEYMYPALYAASRFEAQGKDVRFHATTRSPIAVSTEDEYPFHVRYELRSLYDSGRTTYIYDLQKYDMVVICTDAAGDIGEGIRSLNHALELCGNGRIILVS